MGPAQAISTCFKKYATFSGRASRSEFWWFSLAYILAFILLLSIDIHALGYSLQGSSFSPLATTFEVCTFLPMLAVGIRRFHDIGHSALFPVGATILIYSTYLVDIISMPETLEIALIMAALVGLISYLLLAVKKSVPVENQYGPNPLDARA